ncbi:hypothetical protein BH23CHL5_BH23CHL5_23020 [soil metagenome]
MDGEHPRKRCPDPAIGSSLGGGEHPLERRVKSHPYRASPTLVRMVGVASNDSSDIGRRNRVRPTALRQTQQESTGAVKLRAGPGAHFG